MTTIDLSRHDDPAVARARDEVPTGLRPAALARYLDLTGLRHDFPLVLTEDDDLPVTTLTGVVDELLTAIAPVGARGERLRQHVLRQETAIRRLLDRDAAPRTLVEAWDEAAADLLAAPGDVDALRASLDAARGALPHAGRLVGCDDDAAAAVVRHVHAHVERARTDALGDRISDLVRRLGALLAADERRAAAGRDPDRLRAAVGTVHEDDFDFDAWSAVLASRPHDGPLPEARRSRIEWALNVLRGQRFVATDTSDEPDGTYSFVFDGCAAALAAYHERLPELARVVRATTIARLELENAYDEATHGAFFHTFDVSALEPEDVLPFPGHLVLARSDELEPAASAPVLDLLASRMRVTIALVTTEAIGPPARHDPVRVEHLSAGELTAAALGLGRVPVVQTTTAGLARTSHAVRDAIAAPGPALVNVVTGTAGVSAVLPPYLAAAAATESRAVPTVVHVPVGEDGRDDLSLAANPQPSRDWAIHPVTYEDELLQRVREESAFTVADLVAVDPRFADHVTVVPRAAWTDAMVPVAEVVAATPSDREGLLPYVAVVGDDDVLRRVVVDRLVVGVTERALAGWRRLQARATVPTREDGADAAERSDRSTAGPAADGAPDSSSTTPADATGPAPSATASDGSAESARDAATDVEGGPAPGEAWIETARCTTCDECTTLNPRMFAYNEDKQATIADLRAGTFADLVQAAELCQVAIIHPGEPWDTDEPGLDDLRRRAAVFA